MSCVSLLETNKVLECYPGAMYAKLHKDMIRVMPITLGLKSDST